MLNKYHIRPETVEAMQYVDGDSGCAIANWLIDHSVDSNIEYIYWDPFNYYPHPRYESFLDKLVIQTFQWRITLRRGDYIIYDPNVGFYPCTTDTFRKRYIGEHD